MMLLDLIDKISNVADLPGSMIRDALSLRNPLDQLLTPFGSQNRQSGRDVLEQWGMLGANTDGLDAGDVAGTALGVVTDPFTWISGAGALKLMSRAGKGTKAAVAPAAKALAEAAPVASASRALVPYRNPLADLLMGGTPTPARTSMDDAQDMLRSMLGPTPAAAPAAPTGPLALAAPAAPFYSRLRRAVENLPDKPIKSQSVLNMLKKAPEGFSMDEWNWSNLVDVLDDGPMSTKADLLKQLDATGVDAKTIRQAPAIYKYEGPTYTIDQLKEAYKKASGIGNSHISPLTGQSMGHTYLERASTAKQLRDIVQVMENGLSFEDAMKLHGSQDMQSLVGGTVTQIGEHASSQFDSYAMPGGSNYFETLLQERLGKRLPEEMYFEDGYRGPHFHQPNVAAHLRTTTRNLDGVGPTHFIDELQSDWHQKGREIGYGKDYQAERAMLDALTSQKTDMYDAVINRELTRRGIDTSKMSKYDIYDAWGRVEPYDDEFPSWTKHLTPEERARFDAIEAQEGQYDYLNDIDEDAEYIPDSPFANHWQDLGLKRALYDAAAQGSPGIAWTTGGDIQKMVGGGEFGQAKFYDDELVKRLTKLLGSKGQKGAKAQRVKLPAVQGDARYAHNGGKGDPLSGLANYIAIDPDTRARILSQGFPLLSLPLLASLGLTSGEGERLQ